MAKLVARMSQDKRLGWVWLVIRVYVGWQWLHAGLEKIENPVWWGDKAGTALKGYWMKAAGMAVDAAGKPIAAGAKYEWYQGFLKALVNSGSSHWFSYFVVLGEIAVGVGMILGALSFAATFGGAFMNFNYMLAGSASTNPMLFLLSIILLLAGDNASSIGVDRLLLPRLRSLFGGSKPSMRVAPVSRN